MDSIGTLSYFLAKSLLESMWTPYGLHRDFVVFFSREFTGVHVESIETLPYFLVESLLESMWSL